MYRNGLRRLTAGLAGVLLAAGIAVVNPVSAAAVGCSGASCYNKGPVSMGCTADARAITSTAYDVKVIYSPACRAVWASSQSTPLHSCITLQLERGYYNHDHNLVVDRRLSQQYCPGESQEWTNMFDVGWYFRGVWNDTATGHPDSYSPWVYR